MANPFLLLAAMAACVVVQPADARPRDQDVAYKEAQRGKIMPLRRIEQRVVASPAMRGADYLGSEFNERAVTYRLKFMRGGRVIWVDVDARTGRVVQTSGD